MSNNPIEEVERINQYCAAASPNFAHSKRQHDDLEWSQGGRDFLAKRVRLEGTPLSPGAVSLVTRCCYERERALYQERQQYPTQWWKIKPPLVVEASSSIRCATLLCCFVCNQQLSTPVECKADDPTKQSTNSFLKYFSARHLTPTLSSNTTVSIQEYQCPLHSFCSFCDRQSCASCTRFCQRCEQHFCTLCTTTDYTCTVERIFCLDCARTACDGDAMTIE